MCETDETAGKETDSLSFIWLFPFADKEAVLWP